MHIDYLTNKDYFKVLKDFPPYFHKDSLVDSSQAMKLADDKFALIISDQGKETTDRYYPINNFSNTWTSMQYFNKFASELPLNARITAAHYINKAALAFGIETPASLKKVASLAVSSRIVSSSDMIESTESPDSFLLPESFMYKVASKQDVEEYIDNYKDYTSTLSEPEKDIFAANLESYANRYKLAFTAPSIPITPNLDELKAKMDVLPVKTKLALLKDKYIECGPTSNVEEGIALRKVALDEIRDQGDVGRSKAHIGDELLSKMASLYYDKEIDGHKFASALYKLDKMFGWDSEYQTSIPDPVKMVVTDAMNINILKDMDKEIAPILAEYKSGSISSAFMQEQLSDTMTNIFTKFAHNLLQNYLLNKKEYKAMEKFASMEQVISDPVSVFEELTLSQKIAFIKELTSGENSPTVAGGSSPTNG
jgi:hypothetical protein